MNLDGLTIPPNLFYSKTPSDTWKPKLKIVITPAQIRKNFPKSSSSIKKKKQVKKRLSDGPMLGRISKIKKKLIKNNLIKKTKTGNPQKKALENNNNNNNIASEPVTKTQERQILREIKKQDEAVCKRLYVDDHKPERRRSPGKSFKFFKSKNANQSSSSTNESDDDNLVPEIRDGAASTRNQFLVHAEIHEQPVSFIEADAAFEEEAEEEEPNGAIRIETLLENLEKSDDIYEEAIVPADKATPTSMDALINILEGNEESPPSTKASVTGVKQKKWLGMGNNQLQIDAGQDKFGIVECTECQFQYNTNVPEDEILHTRHHQSLVNIPRFKGWAKEDAMTISEWDHNGRVIHLVPGHRNMDSDFITEIVQKMEHDFGVPLEDYKNLHLYIAVYKDKMAGLAAVQDKVIATMGTEESTKLGIQRLFVRSEYRRLGIARAMLKTITMAHYKGKLLEIHDIAFSAPTQDGYKFIKNITGTDRFFTY